MSAFQWDAAGYDRVADPHVRWGAGVLGRLDPSGVERVLDAGCGTGRVTELLLERLPCAHVVALDGSRQMLGGAAERLAAAIGAGRVELVHADLVKPLPVAAVDAVLSTATFHWIPDHDTLFANLAAVLRPGGQLVAQCGGAGNIATLTGALRRVGEQWAGGTYFATPEDTRARLDASGFVDIETWLQAEPTAFEPGPPFEEFLATVILGPHLTRLAPERRADFVHAVATAMPRPEIDYVRLNIVARRSPR
jgi:trans-aconitate 2-methyltransferase